MLAISRSICGQKYIYHNTQSSHAFYCVVFKCDTLNDRAFYLHTHISAVAYF